MSFLSEDLNDSALFCKSIVQKRKASGSKNPKNCKQLRLNFPSTSNEGRGTEPNDSSQGEGSQTCNGTGPDCKSFYFRRAKTANACPLCFKSFKFDSAYSTHMKQCAKTHKITTQELLKALELQKKHAQERRELGLSSQNIPPLKKINSKNKKEKESDPYDWALGVALSRSLTSSESTAEPESKGQKTTLKQTEITSNPFAGPSKKKNWRIRKTALEERTTEARQRILIEKVSVVLLDEDQEPESTSQKSSSNSASHRNQSADSSKKVPQLWNFCENEEKTCWYVNGIKTSLLTPKGRELGEPKSQPIRHEDLKEEISKLNLPQEEIHQDWRKMINSSAFSDLIGKTKDRKTFYLHSIVAYVRWPGILEKEYQVVFQKYNLSTVLIFLEYLYCGTLNGLVRKEIKNLYNLATDFNYTMLLRILNCLENNLEKYGDTLEEEDDANEEELAGRNDVGSENQEFLEEEDLFEDDVVFLTQTSRGPVLEENAPENESNVIAPEAESNANTSEFESSVNAPEHESSVNAPEHESSVNAPEAESNANASEAESNAETYYWRSLQREEERKESDWEEQKDISVEIVELEKEQPRMECRDKTMERIPNGFEEEERTNWRSEKRVEANEEVPRRGSAGSETRDLDEAFEKGNASDCIILSDSESELEFGSHGSKKSQRTPVNTDYEVPHYDPYDNFQWFSEGRLSPVSAHSQSLITGDISPDCLREADAVTNTPKASDGGQKKEEEEGVTNPGYCSTPVTIRRSTKLKSPNDSLNGSVRRTLSARRDLRRSLGIREGGVRFSKRNEESNASQKKTNENDRPEVLTDSILRQMSEPSTFKPLTALKRSNYMEITPIPNGEEFRDSVTPTPDYNNMGETLLKEQLSKYGLKKSLGKNKARKILLHIYEELHPLYNTKTRKIVKVLADESPEDAKKGKLKGRPKKKNVQPKNGKKLQSGKTKEKDLNSSAELSEGSDDTTGGPTDNEGDEGDMENLGEILTQSVPSNPVDLPSAFSEFLETNPEYHKKILLYEPIWLEDLQKKLKENFKKHFKMADLMDYLDQECITFRSEAQVKNAQRKNEKRKKIPEKEKASI